MALNTKQLKFVKLLLATGEKAESYAKAYNLKNIASAASSATNLLKNPEIIALLDDAKKQTIATFPLTYEGALANMWHQATYYGADATHQARVNATAAVIEQFKPSPVSPPPSTSNVNVNVLVTDERLRRIEELRTRIAEIAVGGRASAIGDGSTPGGSAERLLEVDSAAHPTVQVELPAPPTVPEGTSAGDERRD